MKIVYLNPTLCNPDGIERVLIDQANYMAESMSFDVTIILTDGDGLSYGFPLSEKVKVIQLNIGFYSPCSSHSRLGVWGMYFQKMRLYKQCLTDELMRIRPDVTVTMLRRELNFLHTIRDGSRKIGWVHLNRQNYRQVHFGYWRLRPLLTRWWQSLFIRQLRRLDALVALTDEDRRQWQLDLSQVQTIPNPLSFYTEHPSTLQKKQVVAVGRYVYQKGFDRLIGIWDKVHHLHPDWQLHIYGRGNRTPYLQLVNRLQLQDSCFLHPFHTDVLELYQHASIFAFPSRYEGFGLALTEAMHCGLPCVSFTCPCGPRDIIHNGVDGYLVDTEEQFAQALSQLMTDEALRCRMAAQARRSSFRYTPEVIMKQWVALFQSEQ